MRREEGNIRMVNFIFYGSFICSFDEFNFVFSGDEKFNDDFSTLNWKENDNVHDLVNLFTPKIVTMKDLEGKCLAIDMNCWFEQFIITTVENTNDAECKRKEIDNKHVYLNASVRQILKLLINKIRPVFVFEELSSSLIGAEKEMNEQILELIQVFDLPHLITSTNNITPQCGYLEQSGVVDGIVTNDIVSSFLYGGSLLYRDVFNNDSPSHDFVHFSLSEIDKKYKLTRNDFICLTYLLGRTGTDNPDEHNGIDGINDVTALEIVEVCYDKEKEAKDSLEQILNCLNNWKKWVTEDVAGNEEATSKKQEKYVIPILFCYPIFPLVFLHFHCRLTLLGNTKKLARNGLFLTTFLILE
jgi:5'-3' exonuclease